MYRSKQIILYSNFQDLIILKIYLFSVFKPIRIVVSCHLSTTTAYDNQWKSGLHFFIVPIRRNRYVSVQQWLSIRGRQPCMGGMQ